MAKLLNIYLPPCPHPDKGKREIFRDGKRTGEIITNAGVRKLLDREQYIDFLNGEDIFYVPAEKCNPIRMATDSIKDVIGVNREELFTVCKDLEPNFNPLTDYYVIQHKQ